jgi:hypothetical protein
MNTKPRPSIITKSRQRVAQGTLARGRQSP